MARIEDQICLITGGSRGIGAAIVRHFVKAGASVFFTYRSSAEKAEELASELQSEPGQVYPI